jgi:hypothetical protein
MRWVEKQRGSVLGSTLTRSDKEPAHVGFIPLGYRQNHLWLRYASSLGHLAHLVGKPVYI